MGMYWQWGIYMKYSHSCRYVYLTLHLFSNVWELAEEYTECTTHGGVSAQYIGPSCIYDVYRNTQRVSDLYTGRGVRVVRVFRTSPRSCGFSSELAVIGLYKRGSPDMTAVGWLTMSRRPDGEGVAESWSTPEGATQMCIQVYEEVSMRGWAQEGGGADDTVRM